MSQFSVSPVDLYDLTLPLQSQVTAVWLSALSVATLRLAVIGNIAFSSSKKKGKIINSPFTGDEFTRSPSVAQKLPKSDVREIFQRLLQTAPIELIFGGV